MANRAKARKPVAPVISRGARHGSRNQAKGAARTKQVPHHAAGIRNTDALVAAERAAGTRQHRDGLATGRRIAGLLPVGVRPLQARPAAVLTSDAVDDLRLAAKQLADACEAASSMGMHTFLVDTVVTVADEASRAIGIARNELARLIGREAAAVSLARWSKQETPGTDSGGRERQRSRIDRKPQANHG